MYQWVSCEKTCLPNIWSFDVRGKNITFAETIKSDRSWLIIDFKLWSTVKTREQTHRDLKNTFLPTKMRKKRTFMRLMHRLFGIKICCNAHTTISQFHNHTQELKVKYPGMSITGCNKISQSLVFVLTQLYCGHQSSFPLCHVWFYSGLSEVFTFSCGKSILCDQLTHVRRESVDCQSTNSRHFTVSWPLVDWHVDQPGRGNCWPTNRRLSTD